MNILTETHGHEDHGHDHHEEVVIVETNINPEPIVLEDLTHDSHNHSDLNGLWEVMFGFEHVVAEFFWNAVFVLVGFAVSRAVALRKIHKYIDDKHGVSHEKREY
jgi:hypothetical protein